MRFLLFVGMTVGGAIGWWIGSYGGIWAALLVSAAGSLAGVYVAYRLTRDYL
jgi:membrane protein YqaA with SNARE-associated domain